MKPYVLKLKTFIGDNERVLLPVFLLLGFAVDSITLRKADLLPETILIYTYLVVAGAVILLMHLKEVGIFQGQFSNKVAPFLPLAMTYAFGSLFSAFVVFYTKSASITDSWPFILALISVVVGLELLKQYRSRLIFNLTVYFLALFSFSIYTVPLWVGRMGSDIFLLSAAVALAVLTGFCFVLYLTGKSQFKENIKGIVYSVGVALTAVVLAYNANLLPPIPLVLKDVGPYHYVARDGEMYRLLGEETPLLDRLFGVTVHLVKGEPLYVFSSVYTPVRIDTDIVHRWEYWSTVENDWVLSNTVSYPAEGGREEGYRGYSFKRGIFEGKWRVSIETPDGLKIGRTEFTVQEVVQAPKLLTTTR
ncbi:DUF2914 domain-containing protein [Patescibacteria group bacterium]|nr:DUF2914 domain-containing protein [Patescibacteria group bacterium]